MSMTYQAFCEWFLAHYGRPFAASEAEYEAALRQPCYDIGEAQQLQREFEQDMETERREGWGYDTI